jgi:hypothetical protein
VRSRKEAPWIVGITETPQNSSLPLLCLRCQYLGFLASIRRMNDDVERIWKEAVMARLRYYVGIFLEGMRNITKASV